MLLFFQRKIDRRSKVKKKGPTRAFWHFEGALVLLPVSYTFSGNIKQSCTATLRLKLSLPHSVVQPTTKTEPDAGLPTAEVHQGHVLYLLWNNGMGCVIQ